MELRLNPPTIWSKPSVPQKKPELEMKRKQEEPELERKLIRDVKTKLGEKYRHLPLGQTELVDKLGLKLEQLTQKETARGNAQARECGI